MLATLGTRIISGAAAAVDRAVLSAMRSRGRRAARPLTHEERLERLAAVRAVYGRTELLGDPEAFFPAPPPIAPALRRVRALDGGGAVFDAAWPSASSPHFEGIRAAYLAHERNRVAHARLFLAARPRPAVVLIHGYLGGHHRVEELAWPIHWMRRRGLDVALAVLPFHAMRGGGEGPPPLPGADPRINNEGFRQAMGDLRALIAYLRARGAPAVGVMGMSLGGYTTALIATVEADLAFAVPIIPLGSIADFAREQGRLGSGEAALLQHRALEEAHAVVSPFTRPSRIAGERVLVVGAEADRITPIAHAERLARKLGAPLHRLPGGHLLQIGRRDAFREIRRLWKRIGIDV